MKFLTIFLSFYVWLVLSSCTNEAGSKMGIFTATTPVLATIKGDIFIGTTVGDISGAGKIEIESAINPDIKCIGEFRYTSLYSMVGVGTLTCSDGNLATFNFNALDSLSGHGYGSSSRGPVTFTYGLTPKESAKYLQKPFPEIEKFVDEKKERDQNSLGA